ncbi:LysR substrate-binding domain-containing protein [Patulibacter americanus]|uniref:LysR substrate-binding domain-containing protein n=1 Tax=Patulibacter americanus TaxID=588672 RepID=UPI00048AF695
MHLDLNLLVALDALLEEGSVGGAAARLHLSSPAMSRTLGRIRTVTGDQILVRTGRTMTPTPFALGVRERVHALVVEAQTVLAPERDLDLSTLTRTFTVQAHDAVTTAIGPLLLEAVRTQAPGVALRLLPERAVDTLELKHGHLDLEIGSATNVLPEIRTQTLLEDRLVVALRAGHDLAARELTPERFAAADHVIVSRRGRLTDPIDDLLEAQGLRRRVLATAPTSTAALHFAAAGDPVVVVSERLCRPTIAALGLRTAPVPLDVPPVPLVVAWHERYEGDRAHAWLRSVVAGAVERVAGGDPGPDAA